MTISADPAKVGTRVEAADETTPLLNAPEGGVLRNENGDAIIPGANGKAGVHGTISPQDDDDGSDAATRMPYVQILVLCFASLAEPIAYFAIFPFVNEMIKRNGDLPKEDVGFWTGLIESLFSLVQMTLMIPYGRLADRIGRKPVLVWSLTGVSACTALFGASKTLWQMILFRCLCGCFAGSVVTIRAMLSENSNKHTQARAFSWWSFTRNLGILIGPLVGGGLANPADQFPGAFGRSKFFHDYPYLLSTLVAGAVCLTATTFSFFCLNETLDRKPMPDGVAKPKQLSSWELLASPGVSTVLYIYAHVSLMGLAYTATSPVFLFEPIKLGGFGFSPAFISYFLAVAGASQAFWMLLGFPPLQRTIGTGNLIRVAAVAWPINMALFPIYNEFLRKGWTLAFWICAPITLIFFSGLAMSFAAVQLCLNDISPSPTVLATINAIALTITSGIRAIAPALFTSLYAWGIKINWAHGHLAWFVLIALGLLLNVSLWFLPEAAEGRPDKSRAKTAASHNSQVASQGAETS